MELKGREKKVGENSAINILVYTVYSLHTTKGMNIRFNDLFGIYNINHHVFNIFIRVNFIQLQDVLISSFF